MNYKGVFFLFLFCLGLQSYAGVLDFYKTRGKSYHYGLSTHEDMDFVVCKDFEVEDNSLYYITCLEEEVHLEPELDKLMSDSNAIETKIIKDNFLQDLRRDLLKKLAANKKRLEKFQSCLAANDHSKECQMIKFGILKSAREDLPKMRALMAQYHRPGHVLSPVRVDRFVSDKLRHKINKKDIPPLTSKEKDFLKKHTAGVEKAFRHEVLLLNVEGDEASKKEQRHKVIKGINECAEKQDETYVLRQTNTCQKYEVMLDYRVNNEFERQNKVYKKEYNKLISANPLLVYLDLSGEEKDRKVFEEMKYAFENLINSATKKIKHIEELENDDLIELLGVNTAVEGFLKERGPNRLMCDVAQDLKSSRDWDETKLDIYLGLGALAGGGACAISFGLGCAAMFAVGIEAAAISISRSRYNDALEEFNLGVTDAQTIDERETQRDLAMYLAPLALLGGPGKFVLEKASVLGQQTLSRGKELAKNVKIEKTDNFFRISRVKDPRRIDIEQRKAIDVIRLNLGGKFKTLTKKYNPKNILKLTNAEQVYFAGIANMLEKQIKQSNPSLRPRQVREKVKKELNEVIKECRGENG